MVRQWSWLGCVRPSLAGLQTWVIANSFLIQESSGPAKVPSTFPPLFWWLYCNCLFVFHARCLKHWCSSDHQTWHRNVPPSVLETHYFGVTELRGQGHNAQNIAGMSLCTLVSAGFFWLGRLLRVDLMKWVSNARTSVRSRKVSSISIIFGM